MTKGCIIFAHDGDIDYGSQAVLAAKLATKHLKVPVSLISDQQTIYNIQHKFDQLPFDQIIQVDLPANTNKRNISNTVVSFINTNRASVWDLTPYDRTLVIDSDFLIFSDTLNKYWNDDHHFLITPGMLDLLDDSGERAYKLSQYTINMLWATNFMFTKNNETKIFFDLIEHIRAEYSYYSRLYEFNDDQYRNDYAFSIACHLMSNYGLASWHGDLPCPLIFKLTDDIVDIKPNSQITFLVKEYQFEDYYLAKSINQDIHIMNKHSLLENLSKLLELTND